MHIVDRRLNPGGKSFTNRQRFLRRAEKLIRRAVHDASRDRGIEDLENPGEISIPIDGIREPTFSHANGVRRDLVLPGNRRYVEGDLIDRPEGGGGGSGGASAGDGNGQEDAFRFVLTREEFLDIFLDDLELPDLAKRRLARTEKESLQRAGYTVSGSPANLAMTRTMRMALTRRIALKRPGRAEIERLERELEDADAASAVEIRAEIERLEGRRARVAFLDPIDLRYRRYERVPRPITQAVMFCLMDASASMTEHMKDVAKRFFMLLHVFLTRRYERIEVVFIRHTDQAREVDEETFFRSSETGGTLVSSAFVEMLRIVRARYDVESWNIYAAQASDGDNLPSDNDLAVRQLADQILPMCQYFAYLEVCGPNAELSTYDPQFGSTSLWNAYAPLRKSFQKFQMRRVSRREQIYPVFRQLFARKGAEDRAK